MADKLNTMTYTDTAKDSVNVELSWYPNVPRIHDTTFFKVQFLDKQTGQRHAHIDYTFAILNSTNSQVGSVGPIHASDGREFMVYTFVSQGSFTPVVTVRGISFIPIVPDEAVFGMAVTPEFPTMYMGATAAAMVGSMVFYFRTRRI